VSTGAIEGEYIRNLQNQIYYLELECKYLREQAEKVNASDLARQAAESKAGASTEIPHDYIH
jgi:hypothetical protein